MIKTEALQSNPSKTLGVFDGFDFLLARLQPSYKMPSVQRAMTDELYKVAGASLLSIANDNDSIIATNSLSALPHNTEYVKPTLLHKMEKCLL